MKKFFLLIILSVLSLPAVFAASSESRSLQLRVEPAYFSPGGDGLQDQTFFYPVFKSQSNDSQWTLDISTVKGRRRVVRITGARCPALIKWDGLDKKKERVPDGAYIARLTVGGWRSHLSAEQTVVIDTKPPQVTVSLSTDVFDRSLINGSVTISPRVTDDSPVDRWLAQVIDPTGRTVAVFSSTGAVQDLHWNGTDRATGVIVPRGKYRVAYDVWDKAGNESDLYFADLSVDVTPREMLEHALQNIRVNETAIGLIVQLEAGSLFAMNEGQLEISEQGRNDLKEVAVLINAYSDVPVKLDGYYFGKKKAASARSQSSLYAWRVYSYLSKNGNVKASRLTVRGRGRSPMFDRRGVGLPLLQNGVEVVLEGKNVW